MILGFFNIKYMPRTSVKSQILTNLVAEFAKSPLGEEVKKQGMDGKLVGMVSSQEPLFLRVYVDGVVNQRGSGMRLVLVSSEKITIEKSLRLGFSATNNEAEYEALLVRMTMVQKIEGKSGDIIRFKIDRRPNKGRVRG